MTPFRDIDHYDALTDALACNPDRDYPRPSDYPTPRAFIVACDSATLDGPGRDPSRGPAVEVTSDVSRRSPGPASGA